MPGCSGVTVVTMLVCFYLFCPRGCGRIARPAFSTPSFYKGRDVDGKTRAKTRGEIAKLCRKHDPSCPGLTRASIHLRKNIFFEADGLPGQARQRRHELDGCCL